MKYSFWLAVILLSLGIGFFKLTEPFVISGASMAPTLPHGTRILIETITWRLSAIERSDLLVFRNPHQREEILIKRVIGLPNERIKMDDSGVTVIHEDGTEEFFATGTPIGGEKNGNLYQIKLGPEDYFLLGDNRSASTDSRHWGAVQAVDIIGKPLTLF